MSPTATPEIGAVPGPGGRWGASFPRAAWGILVGGLLVREALSFWTGHPYDFEIWIRTGHAVAQGQNPYAYWPAVPGSFASLDRELPSAAYLPFWPLLTGALYRSWELVGSGNRFVLYFLLKQPGILGDAGTAYLLYRLAERWGGDRRTALAALAAWSYFPYAIVISAVWGMFDSIVIALLLASLWVRRPPGGGAWRSALFGAGIFVKWITAIYLPLEAFAARGWRRLQFLLGLILAGAATLAAFVAFGWGYQNVFAASVSQSHGGGHGMNWVAIVTGDPVGPVLATVPYLEQGLSYLWIPAVLLAAVLAARWFATGRPQEMVRALLVVTLAFLLFRWGLNEQYLLYPFALAVLDLLLFHPGRRGVVLALEVPVWAYLLVNNDFALRFVSPLSAGVQPFTDAIDTHGPYGLGRAYALMALGAVVTISLVQLLLVYLRDEPSPRSWWARLLPRAAPPAPGPPT